MTYGITTCNKTVIIVCHMHILTDERGVGIMDGMVILSIITWVSNRYGEDRRNE